MQVRPVDHVLAWLRRWQRPIVATAVIATGVTALLYPFLDNQFHDLLISAQVVGFTLLALIYPAMNAQMSTRWRVISVAAALLIGAVVGTVLVVLVKGRDFSALTESPERLWSFGLTASLGFIVGLISVFVMAVRMRIARAEAALLRVEAEKQALARKNAEAELQVIRAQIEPHFLVNTLANVSFLIKENPDQAQAMLENLMEYLQAALPRIRGATSTLRNELAMTSAYVAILQIRMGTRLQACFDVPATLLGHAFPPMMLITLVENAIQHGLNPLVEGGEVRVAAEEVAGRLVLRVSDDGAGVHPDTQGEHAGLGLTNIHERLQAMYGADAELQLQPNKPRGTIATISIPRQNNAE